ncbi:MAG: MATE family efflux transporter [Desulfuromonadaceae bacterium]|nr:MATE family efflux transporter [Desulfuromonadaceae bacterium]
MPPSHRATQLNWMEFKILMRISFPLILAQLAQSSMGFVDTLMAGRVSATDLAAVAVGSSIWFPVFILLLGILNALTPSVSHAYGQKDNATIRALIPQGLYLGAALGLGAAFLLRNCTPLLILLKVDGSIVPLIMAYLKPVSWGFPAIGICFALRYCSEGLSVTRPSMLISFVGLLVNIVVNYVLVFGKLGFPALGGVGCGVGTAATMWVMMGGMLLIFWRGRLFRYLQLLSFRARPNGEILTYLLRLGIPIGVGMFIECSIFAIIALLLSRFGAQTVAAHQIAISFSGMMFMIPLSIATAISVRVSYNNGRNHACRTKRSVKVGLITTLGISILSCTFIAASAKPLTAMYTPDSELAGAAAALLLLAALFQIPDGLQVSCAGALRGFKDTRTPMLLQIVSYWGVGMPLGYFLGLHLELAARGFWIGLICGLSTAALLLGIRLHKIVQKETANSPI